MKVASVSGLDRRHSVAPPMQTLATRTTKVGLWKTGPRKSIFTTSAIQDGALCMEIAVMITDPVAGLGIKDCGAVNKKPVSLFSLFFL